MHKNELNLVTGATGIIGSHVLLDLLLRGREVTAAKRPGSDLSKVKALFEYYGSEAKDLFAAIRWIDLDILDYYAVEEALKNVSHVYHCAGLVSFDSSDRLKLFRVNEGGTANVVNACLHLKTLSLCHASTIGTLNNSDFSIITEEVFWKKSGRESYYALSKYNAEREVWRGMEEGLKAVIVNPGVVLAPVFWEQSSGKIFRQCLKGNRFYTGGSSAYVSARDVARVMTGLTEARHFGNRYIVHENNYEHRQVLGRIQANFGRPEPALRVSKSVLRFASVFEQFLGVFTRKRPVLTKSFINSAFNSQIYSNSKVRETLGFSFEPVLPLIDEICGHYRTVSGAG